MAVPPARNEPVDEGRRIRRYPKRHNVRSLAKQYKFWKEKKNMPKNKPRLLIEQWRYAQQMFISYQCISQFMVGDVYWFSPTHTFPKSNPPSCRHTYNLASDEAENVSGRLAAVQNVFFLSVGLEVQLRSSPLFFEACRTRQYGKHTRGGRQRPSDGLYVLRTLCCFLHPPHKPSQKARQKKSCKQPFGRKD